MSYHIHAVSDFGVVAKIEELDLESMRSFFEEERDISFNDTYSLEEQIINLLMDGYGNEFFCYKETYGNNLSGDFVHILIGKNRKLVFDVDVHSDNWVMMPLPKFPSLFHKQYKNEKDLVESVKKIYAKYIKVKDFSFENRLLELRGVVGITQ